jgi:glycosyltransferase involved in cell wall biosynthesis
MQVTCVIPVHNHAKWVCDALESVAAQAYSPLRIVVVDDGSTDGSTEAVLGRLYKPKGPTKQGLPWVAWGKYTAFDRDVMVCRFQEARGPAFARNWGIQAAWDGTDAYAFLDSDDAYLPGKVGTAVAVLKADPNHVGAVYSDYETLRPDGLRVRCFKEPYSRTRLLQECIVNCDSVVSKRALEAVGTFDESLRTCEDYDLWLRLSERFLIHHVPECQLVIRVGEHSSTSTVPSETWRACYARVFQKLQERSS